MFYSFTKASEDLPDGAFINAKNGRFNVALFEAVFTATCCIAFQARRLLNGAVEAKQVFALAEDENFINASLQGTTRTTNVEERLNRAKFLISAR